MLLPTVLHGQTGVEREDATGHRVRVGEVDLPLRYRSLGGQETGHHGGGKVPVGAVATGDGDAVGAAAVVVVEGGRAGPDEQQFRARPGPVGLAGADRL